MTRTSSVFDGLRTRPVIAALGAAVLLFAPGRASAQFTEVDPGLPASPFPCVVAGDYDADGDVDVLVAATGKKDVAFSTLFRNTGGTFADSGISLLGLGRASAAWGDFDGDGDLDLAMTGQTTSLVVTTVVYRNDGATFTTLPGNFLGVFAGSVAWADADVDGDLDLLVTGVVSAVPGAAAATRLYRNDAGTFTSVPHPFPDCYVGSVAWGDYDRDGDADLAIAGALTSGALTASIWRNDAGTFTDAGANLPGTDLGELAWSDDDLDGDLDLLLGGNSDVGFITRIYRNDGGTFTDANAGLLGLIWSSGAWGDYDRDGDPDLMVFGYDAVAQIKRSILYRNDAGTFTDTGFAFHNLFLGALQWNDYDNDGDADLLLAGNDNGLDYLKLERNDTPASPWVNLGLALAGTHGPPHLAGTGSLVAGSPLSLTLTGALENAPCFLVIGLFQRNMAFKGGTLIAMPTLLVTLTTNPAGQLVLPGLWPAGIPAGSAVFFQDWIKDAGGPHGFASSNGLEGLAH